MLFLKNILKKQFYYYFPTFFYLKSNRRNIGYFFNYLSKKNSTYNYSFYKEKVKFYIGEFFSFETFFISKKFEEIFLIKLIKHLNTKDHIKCIFDVGSNLGFYSLLFSYNDNATVYSFEPFKKTTSIQEKNISINNRKNIILKQLGFSSKQNEGTFFYDKILNLPSNTTNLLEKSKFKSNKNFTQKINISSLEKFCSDNKIERVDFVKIDVEGEEFKIFNDIDNFIKKFQPNIYLEVHKTDSNRFFEPLIKLNELNYDIYLTKSFNDNWKKNDEYKTIDNMFKKDELFKKILFQEEKNVNKIGIINDYKIIGKLDNYKIFAINKNSNFKIDINEI